MTDVCKPYTLGQRVTVEIGRRELCVWPARVWPLPLRVWSLRVVVAHFVWPLRVWPMCVAVAHVNFEGVARQRVAVENGRKGMGAGGCRPC